MKKGRGLVELAQELERQEQAKKDLLAPVAQLELETASIRVNGQGAFPLTDHSHSQIAGYLDIPKKHYDKLRAHYPQLYSDVANTLLQTEHGGETRLVRTLDGNARSFHSNRFQIIDHLPIASHALELFKSHNAKLISSELTESKMYLKAVFNDLAIPFPGGKGQVYLGLCVSNSEIGLSPAVVEAFVLMGWCENGAFFSDSRFRQVHLGRRNDIDQLAIEYMQDDTREATAKSFSLQMRDFMGSIASAEKLRGFVERLAIAQEQQIEASPVKAVQVLAKRSALTEIERDGVLAHLLRGDAGTVELNKFGLSQAVTAFSQQVESYDRATELEKLGGEIITLPHSDWSNIALAA